MRIRNLMVCGNIPQEVLNFFSDTDGKTLLVKGPPGSGKTVFALTLLHAMGGNGVYLSTRVDPGTLYSQIPWIRDEISPENILDATQSERPSKVPGVRPLKYTDVPDFLKAVYIRIEKMTNPIVIIDSWDAVAFYTGYYEPTERQKLEHNICDFARRANIKIIFIVEYIEQQPLDYLVDGVITITVESIEDRRVRKMYIQKLRGTPILHPVYLYTLADGIFRAFEPFRKPKIVSATPPAPIPDFNDRMSTGIRQLDELIGGYGRFNLFEGDHLPFEILMQNMMINAANNGRSVVFVSERQPDFFRDVLSLVRDPNLVKVVENVKSLESVMENAKAPACIVYFDEFEENFKDIYNLCKDAFIFVVTSDESVCKELQPISSTYLKTKVLYGVPCFYGVKPWTNLYVLNVRSEKYPEVSLSQVI